MSILEDYSKVVKSAVKEVTPSGFFNQSFEGVHFQRSYMWELILPTFMAGFIPMPGILLSKLCQKVSFADYSIDGSTDTTRFGAFMAKYPGLLSIPEIKLTFLKAVPDLVTTYFTQWRKIMISPSGLYSPKSKYAKILYLVFLDTTGVIVNRYKFTGVFPLSMPTYSLDYSSNNITNIEINLSVDTIETLY
jgi:hypothetical protein